MERAVLMKNLMWFLERMSDEKLSRVLWYAKKIL